IIASEGEFKASRALKEAADILSQSPYALQLRYLQTLNGIATEQNSTIVFPLPIDLLSLFQKPQLHSNTFVFKKPPTTSTKMDIPIVDTIISSPTATDI
ncbi:unnamed protein product, partial [Rotaria sp. Silwood2]